MKFVPNTVSRSVARKILVAKKNSPHFFFAGGLAAVVTGAVMACRATLQLDQTIDSINDDIATYKARHKDPQYTSEKEQYRDLCFVYTKSAIRLGRLYGPSVVVGGLGIAALAGSHIQLTKRNAALTATLTAVSKAYAQYRVRVQEELGEKRELELYHAISDEKVDVDGKKKLVKVVNPDGLSEYAKIFDDQNRHFVNSAEINRLFLEAQQNYANHRLQVRGHVFLNEIYDDLGFDHTKAGSVVGWTWHGDGDGYIDFGLYDACNLDFHGDATDCIILDFNVDGVIYDKI